MWLSQSHKMLMPPEVDVPLNFPRSAYFALPRAL
jgi:hypothetical protein